MNDIKTFLEIDISALITNLFSFFVGIFALFSIAEKLANKLGIEFKGIRRKNEDHELLLNTVTRLENIEKQHKIDALRLSNEISNVANTLEEMRLKNDATEMAKLKDKLLAYYKKYRDIGKWSKLEHDAFWDLFSRYEAHGGNGHMHDVVEPIMRELGLVDS